MFAGMRRIDLTCLIASPIMAGLLMTLGSIRVAIVGILLWNMLAWVAGVQAAAAGAAVLTIPEVGETVLESYHANAPFCAACPAAIT